MTLMRCLDCGTLSPASRCPEHQHAKHQRRYRSDPYQNRTWRRFSQKAKAGETCAVCGSTARLTLHHVDGRQPEGITEGMFLVLCGSCHSRYEADVRHVRMSEHRATVDMLVDALRGGINA